MSDVINITSEIPINRGRDHENYRGYTDFWKEDGTFVRLKNISLGYTLPKSFTEKLKILSLGEKKGLISDGK